MDSETNKMKNPEECEKLFWTLQKKVINTQAEAKEYPTYRAAKQSMRLYGAETIEEVRRQAPNARYVMSKEQWKKAFHRQIRPREQAIHIKRTFWQEETNEQEKRDSAGNPILGADGQPVRESVTRRVQKEVVVPLYDISQTEGEPFPPSMRNTYSYQVKDYEEIMRAIQEVSKYPIKYMKFNEEDPDQGTHIRVDSNLEQRPTVYMTLLEMTRLNIADHGIRGTGTISKNLKWGEKLAITSEAATYITCKHLGIETIDFTAPALVRNCSNRAPELVAFYGNIRGCALTLMRQIDTKLAEIQQEKGLSAGQEMLQRQGDAPEQTKVSIKEQLAAAQAKAEQNKGADAANLVKHDKAEER